MSQSQPIPYPRFCAECSSEAVQPVQISYMAEVKHDGKLHQFLIPVLGIDKCEACGEEYFTSDTDRQISRELRTHLCFLQPEQIRQRLKELGINQSEFAQRLGVAKETVSRWLTGHVIQSRAMDNLMRLFLEYDQVRAALRDSGPIEGLGLGVSQPTTANNRIQPMDWVARRQFSSVIIKRRESFELRITGVTHDAR